MKVALESPVCYDSNQPYIIYDKNVIFDSTTTCDQRTRYAASLQHHKCKEVNIKGLAVKNVTIRVILVVFVLLALVGFIVPYVRHGNTIFTTGKLDMPIDTSDEHAKIVQRREKQRGALASVFTSIFMAIMAIVMDGMLDVDAATSSALVGAIFGNMLGFLVDQFIGTETGLALLQRKPKEGLNFAFGSIASGTFARYSVTVIFDMFVSLTLFNLSFKYIKQWPFFRCPKNYFIANAILSSVIALITFYAFTNKTRFLYAYPSDINTSKRLDSTNFFLVTALAGLIFVITPSDTNVGIGKPSVKLLLLIGTLILMLVLSICGVESYTPKNITTPVHEDSEYINTDAKHNRTKTSNFRTYQGTIDNANIGKLVLVTISIIVFFVTTSTSTKRFPFNVDIIANLNRVSSAAQSLKPFIVPTILTAFTFILVALPTILS